MKQVLSFVKLTKIDQFAVKLGYANELGRALIKLQVKNLSAMDADWLYSAYNHSHPILVERLRALGYKGGENILGKEKEEVNGKVE
jgi:STE24 endopeptidase